MNFYTGKKTWDLKSKKLAAFKPSCPEFGYLPFTIPSVSEIDIVTRLKENNTRLHLGMDLIRNPLGVGMYNYIVTLTLIKEKGWVVA